MNTMIVQGKAEMMAHIPHHHHHQLKAAGMTAVAAGPGVAMQHPGLTHAGMVGLNGENHVKRPMNAFMVSEISRIIFLMFFFYYYLKNLLV